MIASVAFKLLTFINIISERITFFTLSPNIKIRCKKIRCKISIPVFIGQGL